MRQVPRGCRTARLLCSELPQSPKDTGICSIDVPTVTVSTNVGVGPASVEFGSIYVVDWKAKSVHSFTYVGGGAGWSASFVSVIGSLEVGILKGVGSTKELTGWGWAATAAAALGTAGASAQSTSNFSLDYGGAAVGHSAGFGAAAGGLGTYTWPSRTYSFGNAPKKIAGLVAGCGGR